MKAFLESLSLSSGAALIAVVSAGLAWLIGRVRSAAVRWCSAVLMPLALSYCCYWMPVWLGGGGDQHSSWTPLVVGVWFLAGLIVSVVVLVGIKAHGQ
jgi:hypothetical protein